MTATLGTVALTLSVLSAVPAASAQEFPGADEIVSSPNMRLVANIPQTDPLTGTNAIGSDLAFQGDYAFQGNYLGFTIYDIKHPKNPRMVSQVLCPGSQNDVSIAGDLLFLSTDSRRTDDSCASTDAMDPNNYWEGIKIFDVRDKRAPRYIKSVETACGSHTHTLVPEATGRPGQQTPEGLDRAGSVYLYISSYSPNDALAKCKTPHDKISIIKVPLRNPTAAAVVATPVLFPDGGFPGVPGTYPNNRSTTSGCHDLTVFPEKNLMAGACMGDGVLFDISNRLAPRTISRVQDERNFAFWHSASFNNEATKVIFTDELGGGTRATCIPAINPNQGADAVYDIVGQGDGRRLEFRSLFKIDRMQSETENCVAHNGSLIPVRGKDIMVQAWYQGGMQVWDFTDSSNPQKIGFLERGPFSDTLTIAGHWSVYWYNGYIYGSDIRKGLDVIELNDPRTNQARSVKFDEFNVQTQYPYGRR